MMRLLGFVAGSVLTAAVLMAVVEITGKPTADSGEAESAPDQARPAAAEIGVDQALDPSASHPTTASDAQTEDQAQAIPTEITASAAGGTADTDPGGTADADNADESGHDLSAVAAQIARQVDSTQPDTVYAGTYLFWSPFASEWGARGFARRLSAATRVPVEVLQSAPHRYRVGFTYKDETQRSAWIERIQSVTGLELEPATAAIETRETSPAPVP